MRRQVEFQRTLLGGREPERDEKLLAEQFILMNEEIGELISADKSWRGEYKNYREHGIAKEELADCFIVLMNIAIYSGICIKELGPIIREKQEKNMSRFINRLFVDELKRTGEEQ